MFHRARRLLLGLWSPATIVREDLAREAAAIAREEGADAWVVIANAAYLPTGGRDRFVAVFHRQGGSIERVRTPERGPSWQIARDLDADESTRTRTTLEAMDPWHLGDHLEPVRDGLECWFAFAKDRRSTALRLHAGTGESKHSALLQALVALTPEGG